MAYATNFGSTAASGSPVTQVSLANNKNHRVDFFDTTTRIGNITQWALDNQFPRFDFTWLYVDGSDYDVRVSDWDAGDNGLIGWVNCPAGATETGSNPNRTCYGQRLNYNLYSGYAGQWDTAPTKVPSTSLWTCMAVSTARLCSASVREPWLADASPPSLLALAVVDSNIVAATAATASLMRTHLHALGRA